ncbi:MAG: hypothetical protein V8T36_02035 [Ruthenibacterium lactatiformans]
MKKTDEKTILPYDDIPMPGLLLVLAGIFYSVKPQYRRTGQRRPASAGMLERWNAALPAGFSKESAEHIADGRGYSFAKLTYEKHVADILANGRRPRRICRRVLTR